MKTQLKLALRVLARRKFFTFVSLFGISFTLVVLMLAVAVFDHMFAKHAPETRLDRTLGVYRMEIIGKDFHMRAAAPYSFLDEQVRTLPGAERVAIVQVQHQVTAFAGGRKLDLHLKRTDGEFWKILDFEFLEGAPFGQEAEDAGRLVAVINESTRRRVFGDAPAVGNSIEVDGQTFRVAGVVADVPMTRLVPFADVWVPISTAKSQEYRFARETGDFMGLVLARHRRDFPRLRRELARRAAAAPLSDPARFTARNTALETPFEAIAFHLPTGFLAARVGVSPAAFLLGLLLVLGLLFMLLPTMNLVNLSLSRILERASEIGVRKAYGASRARLAGQFVLENVVLTFVGAALGFVISAALLALINRSGAVPYAHFALNLRIFGWGALIALFFGVLSGALPAWRMARLHPVDALKGAAR